MRTLVTSIIAILLVQILAAQTNEEKYFVFDKNWKGTDMKNAIYFLRVKKLGDKEFLWTTYQMYGPRISQEVFQDQEGQVRNGDCMYYHPNGYPDSVGKCVNGLPDGAWWYYDNNWVAIKKKIYEKGLLVKDSAIIPLPDEPIMKNQLDSGEVESSFKGGVEGWRRFLNKNFKYPERAINAKKDGTVIVQFIVDTEGVAINPEIVKSVEYSLDEEALRIIHISPNWSPAFQKGRKVKSYKRQPIIFRLTN